VKEFGSTSHSHFKFRSQRKPAQMKSPHLDFCIVMKNLARSPEFFESCRMHFDTLKTIEDRNKPWLEISQGVGPCSRSIGNSRTLREAGFWLRRADSGRMRRAHQRYQNGRKLRKSTADCTRGDGPCSRGIGCSRNLCEASFLAKRKWHMGIGGAAPPSRGASKVALHGDAGRTLCR